MDRYVVLATPIKMTLPSAVAPCAKENVVSLRLRNLMTDRNYISRKIYIYLKSKPQNII